jgi:hypothetical protein
MSSIYETYAFYTSNGAGFPNVVSTCDVYSPTSASLILSDGVVAEIGGGFYKFSYLANIDDSYLFKFKTNDSNVDQREIAALYVNKIEIPYNVWGYPSKTLTQTITRGGTSPVSATPIIFYTNSTNTFTVTNVADEAEIWFTMKDQGIKSDEEATAQISKTGGLLYVNGMTPTSGCLTSADGSLVISGGNAIVTLSANAAPLLFGNLANDFTGEIKTKSSASVVTVVDVFPIEVRVALTRAK